MSSEFRVTKMPPNNALHESCERPLLAESGPSKSPDFAHLNVRFGEKRTLAIWQSHIVTELD